MEYLSAYNYFCKINLLRNISISDNNCINNNISKIKY